MSYGTLVSFTSIIEYIVLPFRFSQPGLVSSSMLAASMGFGFVGCVVFIGVLKRTRQYRKVLLISKPYVNLSNNLHNRWGLLCLVGSGHQSKVDCHNHNGLHGSLLHSTNTHYSWPRLLIGLPYRLGILKWLFIGRWATSGVHHGKLEHYCRD